MGFRIGMEVKGFGYSSGSPYQGVVKHIRSYYLIIITTESDGIIINKDTATPIVRNNQDGLMLLRRDSCDI